MFERTLVVIKGAGDIATGVGLRLFRSGFPVIMTELENPTPVRRTIAFAEAVYEGEITVEGITARFIKSQTQVYSTLGDGLIPIIVDPESNIIRALKPKIVVDAILAKKNLGTAISDAPVVIGLGPGFTAGKDVDVVIETNRGHNLGRVILNGPAEPNTGVPGVVNGYGIERVLRSPADGIIIPAREIGDFLHKGDLIASVEDEPVVAPFDGTLRGMVHRKVAVFKGMKIGDIDPRATREHCYTTSDKALAIGGGVLEAILSHRNSMTL